MREIARNTPGTAKLLNVVLAILLLTLTGPFGTYLDFSFWVRLGFWGTVVSASGIFIHASAALLLHISGAKPWQRILAVVVGVCVGALPSAASVMLVHSFISGSEFELAAYPRLWSNVCIIGLVIAAVQFRKEVWSSVKPEAEEIEELSDAPVRVSASRPQLMSRLPQSLKEAEIISFSMQDHYVEVTTTLGKHMLLMRFADALELLDPLQGVQLHRSHWSSVNHLTSLRKEGRKHIAILSDGRELPVSTTFLETVKLALKEKSAA